MKTRMSTILFFVGASLLIWHYHLDPNGVILSDIPNDPNVTEGWPWFVGAGGIIALIGGLVLRSSENERIRERRLLTAKRQAKEAHREREAEKIRIRWSAETGVPQYRH